jgi:hypothetical protein
MEIAPDDSNKQPSLQNKFVVGESQSRVQLYFNRLPHFSHITGSDLLALFQPTYAV